MDLKHEASWQRKLRRLRTGAEPIRDQLTRQGRATLVLSAIAGGVGMIFLAIFAAFGRVDVGGVMLGVLILPVISLAWIDFAILRSRALAYLAEREASEMETNSPR